MVYFRNDYSEGCHEAILEALLQTNREQTVGYGFDEYCEEARDLIRREIGCPDCDVWFIPGGTQTNLLAIAGALRPHEAILGAESCHPNQHETGAIEATGHKVLTVPDEEGKVRPEGVLRVLKEHDHAPHMVKPRLVFVSQATEIGTVYTKAELEALHRVCRKNDLLLYLDGARLGAALVSEPCDLTMKDLPRLCDFFYIGGTKNGALMGEALVIVNPEIRRDFLYLVKQRGALFAKGRLLGLQFSALFRDGLYYRLAEHAVREALRLAEGMKQLGIRFANDSPTNQQFIILPEAAVEAISSRYQLEEMSRENGEVTLRACTSWATDPRDVDGLLEALKDCLGK